MTTGAGRRKGKPDARSGLPVWWRCLVCSACGTGDRDAERHTRETSHPTATATGNTRPIGGTIANMVVTTGSDTAPRHPCERGHHRWAWLVDGGQACGYCGARRR